MYFILRLLVSYSLGLNGLRALLKLTFVPDGLEDNGLLESSAGGAFFFISMLEEVTVI